jgi:hypothetical protein
MSELPHNAPSFRTLAVLAGCAAVALPIAVLAHEPRRPHVDGEGIAAEVRAAVAEATRAAELARGAGEEARREARRAMATGSVEMLRGADEMEQGAREMAEESVKLRRAEYREEQIAKAAARGELVTHEELIEAADGLEEGSKEMRDGAREMREAAERMRQGRG